MFDFNEVIVHERIKKGVIIRLTILLVLILSFFIGFIQVHKKYQGLDSGKALLFSDESSITQLIITNDAMHITLVKDDINQWWIELHEQQFPARTNRVTDFISSVLSIHAMRVASQDEKNLSEFGLDDASAYKIQLVTATGQETMWISTSEYNQTLSFARTNSNESTIYEINNSLSYYLSQTDIYWTNLQLFKKDVVTNTTITALTVNFGAQKKMITRDMSTEKVVWNDENGQVVETGAVNTVLNALHNIEANVIAYTQSVETVSRNALLGSIIIELENGEQFQVYVYPVAQENDKTIKDEDIRYYIYSDPASYKTKKGIPFIYEISAYKYNSMFQFFINK